MEWAVVSRVDGTCRGLSAQVAQPLKTLTPDIEVVCTAHEDERDDHSRKCKRLDAGKDDLCDVQGREYGNAHCYRNQEPKTSMGGRSTFAKAAVPIRPATETVA
jgi:hypothetical protein